MIDTVALRLLCWDRDPNACSLALLHAPQVRALTTYTTVAMKIHHRGDDTTNSVLFVVLHCVSVQCPVCSITLCGSVQCPVCSITLRGSAQCPVCSITLCGSVQCPVCSITLCGSAKCPVCSITLCGSVQCPVRRRNR